MKIKYPEHNLFLNRTSQMQQLLPPSLPQPWGLEQHLSFQQLGRLRPGRQQQVLGLKKFVS